MPRFFMSSSNKNIAIVCNAQAGNGKALHVADEIVVQLRTKQIAYTLFTAYWPQLWNEFTEAWIVGGDGTLNYFINQYPDLNIPLSIFRGGSGNDFQKLLYEKISTASQIEKILSGTSHPVDAGICNGKFFLNSVGIGFDGAIVKELLHRKKNPGKSSYLATVLKNIFSYKGKYYTIEYNDKRIEQYCLMLNIANGKTEGGGFKIAPKASIDDGKLDLTLVGEISSLKRLFYLSAIEKGKHLNLKEVQYHHTDKIEIYSSGILPAHMDGEYFSANQFKIECSPKRFSFLW